MTTVLCEKILKALAGSSSQMPVTLAKLKLQVAPRAKLAELTAALDLMCQSHELQTCSGIKGGKAYVSYWISGNIQPAWGKPSKVVADVKKLHP